MYENVKSCLKMHCTCSDFFDVCIGIRQGETMSPILFSLFLEDLELFLQDNVNNGIDLETITLFLLMFADDMVILAESPMKLQENLNKLSEYCEKWKLHVNIGKTKIVIFRKGGKVDVSNKLFYENTELEIVDSFCYLGCVMSSNGKFSVNCKTLAGKGLKSMYVLFNKIREFNFTPKVQCELFDAFVNSTMSYACEVWGSCISNEIEKIHLSFCKKILGVTKYASNAAVYGELKRYPLYLFRYIMNYKVLV